MTQPVVSRCPFCDGSTEVTEVSCLNCDVQIRGHFTLSRFDGLAPEHLQFLEAFLRSRGVIRDVEAMLGISYPTVRARLDALLTALDFHEPAREKPSPAGDKAGRRKEILAAIGEGKLDAEAGLKALGEL
jgi:hypothetical protein